MLTKEKLKIKKESLIEWLANHETEHPSFLTQQRDLRRVLAELKEIEEKELLNIC